MLFAEFFQNQALYHVHSIQYDLAKGEKFDGNFEDLSGKIQKTIEYYLSKVSDKELPKVIKILKDKYKPVAFENALPPDVLKVKIL